ncbi:MAG: peptidylprolyl isomerase [Deltaproteobacteria bacterium]|jgi:cyclophilin family peptidyl-prolyl cis-trans isomerase|nr:peptidylprolyl isomerase [Deltaproteobacteria bacterium]
MPRILRNTMLMPLVAALAVAAGLALLAPAPASAQGTPNPSVRQTVVFDTTMGTFEVELYNDLAPKTAENFATLVGRKFYDGTIFHRVIDGFMIQGGDPEGRGTGGPGYTIPDEFGPGLQHDAEGILSMANSGPNSGGSQFFITLAATSWLDGKHAIFGHVISGMDVVKNIGKTPVGAADRPRTEVKINSVTIKGAEAAPAAE